MPRQRSISSWLRPPTYKTLEEYELQEDQHPEDDVGERHARLKPPTNPGKPRKKLVSMRTLVQSTFIVFCMAGIAALLLLRYLDARRTGFHHDSASSYYWKYGPTAVLIVATAIWRQFDYLIRSQEPWQQMVLRSTPVQQSLLLDYLSPILPSAYYRSIRNRHWNVVLSISVFGFLKVAVVASTALFVPLLSTLRVEGKITQLDRGGQRASIPYTAGADDQFAVSYVGARQRGLQWPTSALPYAAFQDLSTVDNDIPEGAAVLAQVRAFYPLLECEVTRTINSSFQVRRAMSSMQDRVYLHIDYQSVTDSGKLTLTNGAACDPVLDESCSGSRLVPTYEMTGVDTGKYIISLVSVLTEQKPGNEALNSSDPETEYQEILQGNGWIQKVDWITTLICRPDYSIEMGELSATRTVNGGWTNKALSDPLTHDGEVLSDYPPRNLSTDVWWIGSQAGKYLASVNTNTALLSDLSASSWFEMMLYEVSSSDAAIFADSDVMIDSANKVFQGLASTWVASWLDFPDHLTTESVYTYPVWRLRISTSSFSLMVAMFGVSSLCVLVLLYRHLSGGIPMQASFIMKDARILSGNLLLHSTLKECGSKSDGELDASLANSSAMVKLSGQNDLRVELQDVAEPEEIDKGGFVGSKEDHYWAPMSTKLWFLLVTLFMTIATIIGLELVQISSDANSASLTVKGSLTLVQELLSVLPALVMLTIAMLFSSAEFSIATLGAYLGSHRSPKPIANFLSNPLQHSPPHAIFTQLRLGSYITSIILFASLLGSTLTIAAAGLYSLDSSPYRYETIGIALDQFDFDADLSNVTSGSNAFTFVQRMNESFPSGTFHEIAYPLFTLDGNDAVISNILGSTGTTLIEVEMPVVRASLNCSIVPESHITIEQEKLYTTPGTNMNFGPWVNITTFMPLPDECVNTAPSYNDTDQYFVGSDAYNSIVDENETVILAQLNSPKGVNLNQPWLSTKTWENPFSHYPPGCPSIAFTIGTYVFNGTDTSTTTQIVCDQFYESVPATLTFAVPGLKLDESRPPILHEDRASIVSRLAWNFADIFKFAAPTASDQSLGLEDDISKLSDFFGAVVYGIDGVPIEELAGQENEQKFIHTVQHIYRVYMAQILGNDMRKPLTASTPRSMRRQSSEGQTDDTSSDNEPRMKAFIQDTTRMRIVQNRTSKIVLQVILSIMALCLLVGCRDLLASGKILPHSPCTVAGRMSYVAGSTLVQSVGKGGDERKAYKRLDAQGLRVKLGWWQDEGHQSTGPNENLNDVNGDEDHLTWSHSKVIKKRFGLDFEKTGARLVRT